jgi:hypothetical protein
MSAVEKIEMGNFPQFDYNNSQSCSTENELFSDQTTVKGPVGIIVGKPLNKYD